MPSPTHPDARASYSVVSLAIPRHSITKRATSLRVLPVALIRRQYSDAAKARIEEEGIPLPNSGPTTAALLAYVESHWLPPTVVPSGWSTDWKHWDYLLTLFAYSPYFLRLPQIEMLVNVKYAIPGEVKPVMYSSEHEALVFAVDREDNGDAKPRDAERQEDEEEDGSAEVFYLNCRTFELYAFDPEHAPNVPPPETIDELLMLIGTAPPPAPSTIPLFRLSPDENGEATLKRILARDDSVIPVLERDFLQYRPRATTLEEELVKADEVDAARREKLAAAIENAREYLRETEEELKREQEEVRVLREQEGLQTAEMVEEQKAYLQMHAALEDAKAKLVELEQVWKARYGVDKTV
ncbi:hypothetical protein C8F01DRAFT_1155969 [Mycena amicta]|nr:hypothetical protein C8F01DRAFT_1155969 [Mycena amicta]